ncbi:hypothetical protein [Acidisphaera sp. S103]|uniref:hypothetical protein n=1 Tax=Acidisphaera sp. S103 TaxID=1747223 RepID=UPI00131EB223|nr:hypothetical protein [Acidisphaera sp. S103]
MPNPRTALLLAFAGIATMCTGRDASAADRFFLYNLTASTTFTGVYLAPAGSDHWGSNQALNDKDKAVDPSERLQIKGIERGQFDAKIVDKTGRTCIKRAIDLGKDTTFDIRDNDLKNCH